jgi:hypothetical protein
VGSFHTVRVLLVLANPQLCISHGQHETVVMLADLPHGLLAPLFLRIFLTAAWQLL